jgi:hypothetical protein
LPHILITDSIASEPPTPVDGVVFLELDDLTEAPPPEMRYYFDAFELCNSLKPFVVTTLFARGATKVVYLDSDIYVVGSFDPVWSALDSTSVLLTPHQLTPPPLDLRHTNEIEVVDQGIFNGGFLAFRKGAAAEAALGWMRSRFPRYGFNDRRRGMFVDQKLLPFLPAYFPDDVRVWRDPCVNIAFWNSHERPVAHREGGWHIQNHPVVFFHLSGYRPARPDEPCTYLPPAANQHILDVAPWFGRVLADYSALFASIPDTSTADYGFACHKGWRLTPGLRRILFCSGRLTLTDSAVLRVLLTDRLRLMKRWLRALLTAPRNG